MNKLTWITLILWVLLGFVLSIEGYSEFLSQENLEESVVEVSAFADKLEPIYTKPLRLVSETTGIDLPIVEVGVDSLGVLQAPKDWNVTGWYVKSARPGQVGNLIINGHYDDNFARPAAFYNLKNIKIGDKVMVVDKLGRSYEYLVVESFFLDIEDPNRLAFLDVNQTGAELTLITCRGVWIPSKGTYSQRFVVKAKLV